MMTSGRERLSNQRCDAAALREKSWQGPRVRYRE